MHLHRTDKHVHVAHACHHVQAQQVAQLEPDVKRLIAQLHAREYLPAIYFVFSRKRCNQYAVAMPTSLVSHEERTAILRRLNELRSTQPDAIPKELEQPLLRGVSSHHAGLLPGALRVLCVLRSP